MESRLLNRSRGVLGGCRFIRRFTQLVHERPANPLGKGLGVILAVLIRSDGFEHIDRDRMPTLEDETAFWKGITGAPNCDRLKRDLVAKGEFEGAEFEASHATAC